MAKKLVRACEDRFDILNAKIFQLESEFPPGHTVRRQLYNTRIQLSLAATWNRENRDFREVNDVYEDESPDTKESDR